MSAAFVDTLAPFVAPFLAHWCEWIATASLQAGVVALAVLLADLALRRFAWPRLRLALHALVIVKLFVPPGVVSGWSVAGFAAVGSAPRSGAAPVASAASMAAAPFASWLPAALFAAWLVVALARIVGGVVRHRRARRGVHAASRPAPRRVVKVAADVAASLGLRRVPEVVVSDAVAAPIVFGGRDALVALPRITGGSLAGDELVHVLLHEFAHVRRRDALAAALVWLGASLFWFHPLIALVARRMAGLRELGCDATVAAHLRGDVRRLDGYRATLLRAAANSVARSEPAGALGFGSSSLLIARLEWLARPRRCRPRLELAGTLLVVLSVGGVALPTARSRIGRDVETSRGDRAVETVREPGDHDLFALARSTVDAALVGRRPPGCLALQYSVMALAAQSEGTAPRAP